MAEQGLKRAEQVKDLAEELHNTLRGFLELKKRTPFFRPENDVGDNEFRNLRTPIIILGILWLSGGGLQGCRAPGSVMEKNNDGPGGDYLVGVKTSLEKVFRDPEKLAGEVSEKAIIKAARNEYESFQIILLAEKRHLDDVRIKATDLICDDHESVIQRENISCYQVGYVETKIPPYDVEYVGWWPDPLLPLESFSLQEEIVQPLWVTVYVPEDAAPGQYHGTIRVSPENVEPETVEVSLTVWDFGLPKELGLQTVFSFYEHCIKEYYKVDVVPQELLRQYYSFLLAHRINPTSLYIQLKPQPKIEDVQFCVDRGLNAINIAYLCDWQRNAGNKSYFTEEFKRDLETTIPQTVAFLQERSYLNKAFVYGPDEPKPNHYEAVKNMFRLSKRIAPGVKRVLTKDPTEELFGYVDVWVPQLNKYNQEKCRRRQENGEEIWWYISGSTQHPYPNFFIDYPAIDHRILFWMTWKYNISGFLYYSLNRWFTNYSQSQDRWPEVPWNTYTAATLNGDGQLMYPGPGGEPCSSIRLEVIRDGIEDFEYLHMLQMQKDNIAKGELEDAKKFISSAEELFSFIREDIISDLTHYTKDYNTLLITREVVAEEILKLKVP